MQDLSTYETAKEWLYSLKNRGSKYGIDDYVEMKYVSLTI